MLNLIDYFHAFKSLMIIPSNFINFNSKTFIENADYLYIAYKILEMFSVDN
jgi:hypothetical protein